MQLRERFSTRGATPLSDTELLALVLGTGTRGSSALDVAHAVLRAHGDLAHLAQAEPRDIAAIHGVGRARAIRVGAALQLGRRSHRVEPHDTPVTTPELAYAILSPGLSDLIDEELHGLFLDRRRRPIALRTLTRGCQAYTIVDPRQIFRVAVKTGASAVILAHNHPSGDPTPSTNDLEVTERVARAGNVLGIPLLDHLVVTEHRFRSIGAELPLPQTRSAALWTA